MTKLRHWLSNLFNRPFCQAAVQCVRRKAQFARPCRKGLAFAGEFDQATATSVVGLFARGCPAAIFGRVISGIVFTFKSQAIRAFPHIGQKVDKAHPTFTNSNATTAIPRIASASRIQTSIFHRLPCTVSSGSSLGFRAVSMNIVGDAIFEIFAPKTSATVRVSADQGTPAHGTGNSAVATTIPQTVLRFRSACGTFNYKTPKPRTSQILHGGYLSYKSLMIKPCAFADTFVVTETAPS